MIIHVKGLYVGMSHLINVAHSSTLYIPKFHNREKEETSIQTIGFADKPLLFICLSLADKMTKSRVSLRDSSAGNIFFTSLGQRCKFLFCLLCLSLLLCPFNNIQISKKINPKIFCSCCYQHKYNYFTKEHFMTGWSYS